jgi:hypothetical protein
MTDNKLNHSPYRDSFEVSPIKSQLKLSSRRTSPNKSDKHIFKFINNQMKQSPSLSGLKSTDNEKRDSPYMKVLMQKSLKAKILTS